MTHLYRLYEWYRHSLLKLIHWCVQAEDLHNLSERNRHTTSELNSSFHLSSFTHTHTPVGWWEPSTWCRWPRRRPGSSSWSAEAEPPESEAPETHELHCPEDLYPAATPPADTHYTWCEETNTSDTATESTERVNSCAGHTRGIDPSLVSTWSAGLYSRSTCPCEAVSCWVWRSRWGRTAVWWPVGPDPCRCRAGAACNRKHPAVSKWTPASESCPLGNWTCASSFLWASLPSLPEWSPAPTWLVLGWGKEGMIKNE